MRGAALNRGRSREGGGEDGQRGLPGQGPKEGRRRGRTPRGADSWVNRHRGGVNSVEVGWGFGEDAVSRAGTQETLWLQC